MDVRVGQRRDFFVKKWFQTRIVGYYLLVLVAGGSALSYVIYTRAVATLRYCLFRGHSRECSTWELLRAEVIKTNLVATVIILALALLAVILISWAVARATRAVRANIRATIAGQDPGFWLRPPRPREFHRLQDQLAAGLVAHQEKIAAVRSGIAELGQKVRQARKNLEPGSSGLAPVNNRELHAGFEKLKHLFRSFKID